MDRRKRETDTTAMPEVHSSLDPILSERLPEMGERMKRNINGVIIISPAVWGGKAFTVVR
jgi:hypothetical protein